MPSKGTPTPKSKGKAANGSTPRSAAASATPSGVRSTPASHSMDMTEAEKLAFKQRLDQTDKYFSISMTSASNGKKRKRASANTQLQSDIFANRLDVNYEVLPRGQWEKMKKYKKFTVGSESIATGECIMVKHNDDANDPSLDLTEQWKAKVLEVRALDEEHVYLRISWLNRPEDLPGGRLPHHGRLELIPSNEMDVIDAMTVNGRIEVARWDEDQEEGILPAADQFFWRQTIDYTTGKLSEIKKICIDKRPQNLDELILQCSNPECRRWLHAKCIAEDAVIRASATEDTIPAKNATKPTSVTLDPTLPIQAKAKKDNVTAELYIKGLPAESPLTEPAESTRIVIHSEDAENSSERPVKCLFCEEVIE